MYSRSFHIPPFPNPFDYLRPTVRVRSRGRGCPFVPRLVYSAQCHLGHLCPCRCRVSFLPLRWKCSPLCPWTTFSFTYQSVAWRLGCFCVCSWRCSEQVSMGCLILLTTALQLGTRSGVARPLLMFPKTSVLFAITGIPILTNSFHCFFFRKGFWWSLCYKTSLNTPCKHLDSVYFLFLPDHTGYNSQHHLE